MTTTSARPGTFDMRRRVVATGGAVLATTLVWAVAHLLGVDLRVDTRTGLPALVVSLPLVIASTLAAALLAVAVRRQLDRWTGRPAVAWTRLAVAVLIVSMTPLAYVQASAAARATLATMHLAVAAILVPLLASAHGSAVRGVHNSTRC